MILKIEQLNKSFKNQQVIKGLDFNIAQNEFVGLVGNNGCGKTTTIRMLLNLIQPDSGSIALFGQKHRVKNNKFRKRLGIVLSDPFYVEDFSVKQYLSFVGKFQGVEKGLVQSRMNDLFDLLKFNGAESKKIKQLSSGNKMKVSIAAALIHNPEFLVLDEPFTHLDIETVQVVLSILNSMRGKKTLLITSHNLDLIANICDRFLVLNNGQIELDFRKEKDDTTDTLKKKIMPHLSNDTQNKELNWFN